MTPSNGTFRRSTASAAATGRRPRLSLDEVEGLVMDKARELLIGESGGLTVSLEHINLEVIIAEAGVPRSSAHRRWPTKDQFVIDFLCDIAGRNRAGTAAFDEETVRVAVRVVQEHVELLSSPEGRRSVLLETIRIATKRNFDALVTSSEWRTYVALTATVISIPDEAVRTTIKTKLRQAETKFFDNLTHFYSGMSTMLGFRAKPPYDFRHVAAAGAALVDGLSLRNIINVDLVSEPLELPAPDGSIKTWTLAAAGFMAILDSMVELDPNHQPLDAQQRIDFAAADPNQIVSLIVPGRG